MKSTIHLENPSQKLAMESKKKKFFNLKVLLLHGGIHVFMMLVCAIAMLPVIYTLGIALKSGNGVISTEFSLFPQTITLDHFKTILFEKPFLKWLTNSLILTLGTVAFTFIFAIPAAYAYSRFKFKNKTRHLRILLLLNAFPSILAMVSIYILFSTLNLLNSYWGLILIYTGGILIFAIWNLKGYFDSIPVQLEEAAMIDGATKFYILIKIIIPLALPAIIVTGMMVFISTWNEYIYAINFLQNSKHYSLAAGLYSLQGTEYTRNWPVFAAGALLASAPILVIYFAIQRYMISGLTAGGVKE